MSPAHRAPPLPPDYNETGIDRNITNPNYCKGLRLNDIKEPFAPASQPSSESSAKNAKQTPSFLESEEWALNLTDNNEPLAWPFGMSDIPKYDGDHGSFAPCGSSNTGSRAVPCACADNNTENQPPSGRKRKGTMANYPEPSAEDASEHKSGNRLPTKQKSRGAPKRVLVTESEEEESCGPIVKKRKLVYGTTANMKARRVPRPDKPAQPARVKRIDLGAATETDIRMAQNLGKKHWYWTDKIDITHVEINSNEAGGGVSMLPESNSISKVLLSQGVQPWSRPSRGLLVIQRMMNVFRPGTMKPWDGYMERLWAAGHDFPKLMARARERSTAFTVEELYYNLAAWGHSIKDVEDRAILRDRRDEITGFVERCAETITNLVLLKTGRMDLGPLDDELASNLVSLDDKLISNFLGFDVDDMLQRAPFLPENYVDESDARTDDGVSE